MNMKLLVWDWPTFFNTLWDMACYPLGAGFWNHIALVGALLFIIMIVGTYAQKFGTDPDAPFDLG
jgi:hypothetical protein